MLTLIVQTNSIHFAINCQYNRTRRNNYILSSIGQWVSRERKLQDNLIAHKPIITHKPTSLTLSRHGQGEARKIPVKCSHTKWARRELRTEMNLYGQIRPSFQLVIRFRRAFDCCGEYKKIFFSRCYKYLVCVARCRDALSLVGVLLVVVPSRNAFGGTPDTSKTRRGLARSRITKESIVC